MSRIVGTVAAVAMLGLAVPAWAGDAKVGAIDIKGAWARATPPKAQAGGAFMIIANGGDATDNLLGAASPVAKTVEIHTHLQQGDVLRMVALSNVEIQPGRGVELAPGGLHIMLMGLQQPLTEGKSFPLELDFAVAGKVTVQVDVKAAGAMTPGPATMHDPAMHEQHMKDPAMRAQHEQHMKDPAHKAMHEQMHGKGN